MLKKLALFAIAPLCLLSMTFACGGDSGENGTGGTSGSGGSSGTGGGSNAPAWCTISKPKCATSGCHLDATPQQPKLVTAADFSTAGKARVLTRLNAKDASVMPPPVPIAPDTQQLTSAERAALVNWVNGDFQPDSRCP